MLGRAIALACPQTPYSADLEKAALAGSWIERYALAGRADISRMAWGVIARDENGLVKGVRKG